jgi:hypothetical protein
MGKSVNPVGEVVLGEEVEVRRRPSTGSLIGVRVGRDLLGRINAYGQARGMTVSQVLREGAEALVSGQVVINYVTISTPGYPVIEGGGIVVVGSPSSGGRSITAEADVPAGSGASA